MKAFLFINGFFSAVYLTLIFSKFLIGKLKANFCMLGCFFVFSLTNNF